VFHSRLAIDPQLQPYYVVFLHFRYVFVAEYQYRGTKRLRILGLQLRWGRRALAVRLLVPQALNFLSEPIYFAHEFALLIVSRGRIISCIRLTDNWIRVTAINYWHKEGLRKEKGRPEKAALKKEWVRSEKNIEPWIVAERKPPADKHRPADSKAGSNWGTHNPRTGAQLPPPGRHVQRQDE